MEIQTTPETRLLRKILKDNYGVALNEAMLNEIDLVYFSQKREAISTVAMYRLINFVLFLALFLIAWIFGQSWWFVSVNGLLAIYNFVHLFVNWKQYKQMDRINRVDAK